MANVGLQDAIVVRYIIQASDCILSIVQSGNHDRRRAPPVRCQRLWSCGLCRLLCCQEEPEHTHIWVWCHAANSLCSYHSGLLLQQGTKQHKAVHECAGFSRRLLPINSSQRAMALRGPFWASCAGTTG